MQMQLDFWHSYWEEYQQKEICQNISNHWQI